MRTCVGALLILLIVTPVLAETFEATSSATQEVRPPANCLAEFDITFWQTLPFAALWSSFAASQLAAGGVVNWNGALYFSAAASAVNAFIHAKKTTAARSR
jgi:hypothetical protein